MQFPFEISKFKCNYLSFIFFLNLDKLILSYIKKKKKKKENFWGIFILLFPILSFFYFHHFVSLLYFKNTSV